MKNRVSVKLGDQIIMVLPIAWKKQIEEAQRLRGWLVNSFAQVEYMLGDLILRCRAFPEYDEYTRTLPHGANDRINRVRTILNRHGAMKSYAEDLTLILDHLAEQQDTRNLLFHGFTTVIHTANQEMGFHFQKFHRQPNRQDARLIKTFTLEQMQRERDDQAAFAATALERFQMIHEVFGWDGPVANQFYGDEPFKRPRA